MVADPETTARQRLAELTAVERRRMQLEERGAQAIDIGAHLAQLAASHPSKEERAQRERERRAMELVRCTAHEAERGSFCRPAVIACSHRLAFAVHTEQQRREMEAPAQRQAIADALEAVGVPERHLKIIRLGTWDLSWATFQKTLEWYLGGGSGLVLTGTTGQGKSGAPAIAAGAEIERGGTVAWVAAPRLNLIPLWAPEDGWKMAPGQRFPPLTYPQVLAARLVVLDDVGAAIVGTRETWRERAVDLIGTLLDTERRIVITSNGTPAALQKFLDAPQIWARLRAWCTWHNSAGPCRRTPKET